MNNKDKARRILYFLDRSALLKWPTNSTVDQHHAEIEMAVAMLAKELERIEEVSRG